MRRRQRQALPRCVGRRDSCQRNALSGSDYCGPCQAVLDYCTSLRQDARLEAATIWRDGLLVDDSEVVRGLQRRARDCRKLVSGESNSLYRGRLLGKASAYEHAAQLVQHAIERGEL